MAPPCPPPGEPLYTGRSVDTCAFLIPEDAEMDTVEYGVPYPITVLLRCLSARDACNTEGIFRKVGSTNLVEAILKEFNEARIPNLELENVHDYSSALRKFVRVFEPHLFTGTTDDAIQAALERPAEEQIEALQSVLEGLSDAEYNTAQRIVATLREIAANSDINQMTTSNNCTIWAVNLMTHVSFDQDFRKPLMALIDNHELFASPRPAPANFSELYTRVKPVQHPELPQPQVTPIAVDTEPPGSPEEMSPSPRPPPLVPIEPFFRCDEDSSSFLEPISYDDYIIDSVDLLAHTHPGLAHDLLRILDCDHQIPDIDAPQATDARASESGDTSSRDDIWPSDPAQITPQLLETINAADQADGFAVSPAPIPPRNVQYVFYAEYPGCVGKPIGMAAFAWPYSAKNPPFAIPFPVFEILKELRVLGPSKWSLLYKMPAPPQAVDELLNHLDAGETLESGAYPVEVLAFALLQWFQRLPEPVLQPVFTSLLTVVPDGFVDTAKVMLRALPNANYYALRELMLFLRELYDRRSELYIELKVLLSTWSTTIIRAVQQKDAVAVFEYLLLHAPQLLPPRRPPPQHVSELLSPFIYTDDIKYARGDHKEMAVLLDDKRVVRPHSQPLMSWITMDTGEADDKGGVSSCVGMFFTPCEHSYSIIQSALEDTGQQFNPNNLADHVGCYLMWADEPVVSLFGLHKHAS